MVKFGKELRKIEKEKFKDKYFNYKKFKQLIKQMKKEKEEELGKENIDDNKISLNPDEKADIKETLNSFIIDFTEKLDKEIKRIYIFFVNKEKTLYQNINMHLYSKDQYHFFDLTEFLNEFYEISEISKNTIELSEFIYYNILAVMKILKKFDHKIIGKLNKEEHIMQGYIQNRLELQNSDLLYLFKFKLIDEVNVLMEDLITHLKQEFKINKSLLKKNAKKKEEKEDQLLENKISFEKAENKINKYINRTENNIKSIDDMAINIKRLFVPWDNFLKISSQLTSKLITLNKENPELNNEMFGNNNNLNYSRDVDKSGYNIFSNYLRNYSVLKNINFSKENKRNIIISLIHTFIFMFSFSIVIPTNYLYLINIYGKNNIESVFKMYGFIMMSCPIGTLISYSYELCFFKKSTKKPVIVSLILMTIGNILYSIGKNYYLFIIGRILIGLSSIRATHKMYYNNYLSKNEVSKFENYFHICSIFGACSGYLFNYIVLLFSNYIYDINNSLSIVNIYTIGTWICSFLCFFLLLFSLIFAKEAHDKDFNISNWIVPEKNDNNINNVKNNINTSNNNDDEKDYFGINDENNNNNNVNNNNNRTDTNTSIEDTIKRDTKMIDDINDQLDTFNEQNNYSDTNLVSKNIKLLTRKEKKGLNYLYNSFMIYCIILFTTNIINESLFVITPYYSIHYEEKKRKYNFTLCQLCFLLGISYLIIYICEFFFFNLLNCYSDKTILLVLLCILLLCNLLNIYTVYDNKKAGTIFNFIFYILILISIVVNKFAEKTATLFFKNIIPNDYVFCKIIQGNTFISIMSNISRIFGAFFPFFFIFLVKYNLIIFSILSFFTFLSLILFIIFYSDIRQKAISRILLASFRRSRIEVTTDI